MENESGEQSSDHPSEMKQLLSAIETLQTAVEELSSGREDERELRESNDRLKDVIENIGEAFFAVDDEFNFVFVNRRAAEMLDRPSHSSVRTSGLSFPPMPRVSLSRCIKRPSLRISRSFLTRIPRPRGDG